MAKKPNESMAARIRAYLQKHPKATGPEVADHLKSTYSLTSFNYNSMNVALVAARKQLRAAKAKKHEPIRVINMVTSPGAEAQGSTVAAPKALLAARMFVAAAGSIAEAEVALQLLKQLQVSAAE